MTIYSQHANRGKVQILATYQGPGGVTSSTVTSLGSSDQVAPLVDALNRVSAFAELPMAVSDTRGQRVRSYPSRHVEALTDRDARSGLLTGTHSLWYEYVCFELHRALADLDNALQSVPGPIRIAVNAEVDKEAELLRVAVGESDGTEPAPTEGVERLWEFDAPMVRYDGGMDVLSAEVREKLDDFEDDASDEERVVAVADLRVLAAVQAMCSDVDYLHFEAGYLTLSHDPVGPYKLFLTIGAPQPGDSGLKAWSVDVDRWVPTDPNEQLEDPDDDYRSATSQSVLCCELPKRPSAESLAGFLHRLDREPQLLPRIVKTAEIGSPLEGTEFVVTALGEG
ncbi:MAG TPA: hypothetical protein VGS97_15510 [Actinocrinis sp.]|uniref:hypothetical protein n=1 Tax=Actinocrinis sp. TaxID=1920516 RepID=UPI002DDD5228|nr:hypothetical protein [Actinocrinis sp.]HEV2345505.1 hypothetical protein [Actinocrinis sp.]